MRTVALLPVKNEEAFLPLYLASVKPVVDEIVAIDDGSTDRSVEILRQTGAQVHGFEGRAASGWKEFDIRQRLLELGRQAGGTHFVCLDADEAFTMDHLSDIKAGIQSLRPGQKLFMRWLALWKSADVYRDDDSAFGNLFKDFAVCPEANAQHDYAFLGVGRTPGPSTGDARVDWPLEKGAVLHFQFVAWERFQIKQAWYQCSELIKGHKKAFEINETYAICKDDPQAKVTSTPSGWLTGLSVSGLERLGPAWHLEKLRQWFDQYGITFFEALDIWDNAFLRQEFLKRAKRAPAIDQNPTFLRRWSAKIERRLKNWGATRHA